jgi:hypothetical protein
MEMVFSYRELQEEIYIPIPSDFEEFNWKDLKNEYVLLKKLIYRLVQVAQAW